MSDTRQTPALSWLKEAGDFECKLKMLGRFPLSRETCTVLQVNVSRKCNLACLHCHVNAGPARTEIMAREVLDDCLRIARDSSEITTIDITGGSPETNPNLAWFIAEVSKTGKKIIVRSNLVIFAEPAYRNLPEVFAGARVEIVSSIADYPTEKTDRVRGIGFFKSFIGMIGELNRIGYGMPGTGLKLHLAHNPAGPYLPGAQKPLEAEFRKKFADEHGVYFNDLYCITNMPVGRFLDHLIENGGCAEYFDVLTHAFNPCAVDSLMCRHTVSIGWDGRIYDCDFNQMLGIPSSGKLRHVSEPDWDMVDSAAIEVRNHCFGCTAGAGSSCRGVLCK
jgi:radical SAM/Cys-rich protein